MDSEFKSDTIKVFQKYGIEKRRTLAASPFLNGIVERENGKLKMLLSKNKEIVGGNRYSNLDKCRSPIRNPYLYSPANSPNPPAIQGELTHTIPYYTHYTLLLTL